MCCLHCIYTCALDPLPCLAPFVRAPCTNSCPARALPYLYMISVHIVCAISFWYPISNRFCIYFCLIVLFRICQRFYYMCVQWISSLDLMVSHSIDFELYSRLVYKCLDCSEPSGVGFDSSRLCRLHVQCVVYIVYLLVPFDPLPCPLRPLCGPHVPPLALQVHSHTSTWSQCILCALFHFDIQFLTDSASIFVSLFYIGFVKDFIICVCSEYLHFIKW